MVFVDSRSSLEFSCNDISVFRLRQCSPIGLPKGGLNHVYTVLYSVKLSKGYEYGATMRLIE